MFRFLIVPALAASFATNAHAESIFDGFYGAVDLGFANAEVTDFSGDDSLDASGAVGGISIGYNLSSGNLVYGVEGSIGISSLEETELCTNPDFDCFGAIDSFASLTIKGGLVANDLLFYAKAGLATADVTLATAYAGGVREGGSSTPTGWVAGAGVEGELPSTDFRVRGEILYYDFGEDDYDTDVRYTSETTMTVLQLSIVRSF